MSFDKTIQVVQKRMHRTHRISAEQRFPISPTTKENMKKLRHLPVLLALVASGAFLDSAQAQTQIVNGNFSDGINNWTVLGTNTLVPFTFNLTPKNLGNFPGVVTVSGNTALVHSDNNGPLVASSLSQNFQLRLPSHVDGSGRLRMKSGSIHLGFNWQALSNEGAGAPFDYVRGELNGKALFVDDLRNPQNNNQPGAFGFNRSSALQSVSEDITHLLGKNNNLSFFASDTIDAVAESALAISDVRLVYSHVILEDTEAINSVYLSGLPTALVQRELLLNVAFNANRDVNSRIFRLRSEAGLPAAGLAGPTGYSKDGKESKKEIVPEEKRWAFFATGAYGYRDQNNIDLSAGFQTDLFTATIGGEYKVTSHLTLGLAASRIEAENDLGGLGSADIEGWSFDGYVSYATSHFYADLLYALGTYNHQIDRHTGFSGTATARPDSLTNSIQFNTGYNIPMGRFITGPLAGLNWVHGNIDGYNEQQGGVANLTVPEQNVDSLTSELGWQLSLPIQTGFGYITPQVRASWVHEYLNTAKSLTVELDDSPFYAVNSTGTNISRTGGFNATGGTSGAGADYLGLGAGVSFAIGDRAQ
jgi:uncharacterized protein YhjY with autotransporter beta-barrel domain